MKGRIGQRAFYDRLPAALDEAMAEWGDLTGRRYAPIERLPLRGRRARSSSRWARWPTRRSRWSTTSARQGRPVGCVAVTCFRPFPADGSLAARPQRPVDRCRRADRRAARGRQPADSRGQGGSRTSAPPRAAMVPRVVSVSAGLGSRDVGCRRPRRRLRLAGRPSRAGRCAARRRSASATRCALPATPLDLRPPGAYQPARPLDRRLRLGDDEQARRHARRRAVRHCRSRPTRATARRRRACRRPTT